MTHKRKPEDPVEVDHRRRQLLSGLSAALLAQLAGSPGLAWAQRGSQMPAPMPAGQSIYSMRGSVFVNGRRVTPGMRIGANDRINTGRDGQIAAVLGGEGILLRENTQLQLAAQGARQFFRLVSGAMLAVFEPRRERATIITPTATIGIRGTGVYFEVQAERSYVCTCYGEAEITATGSAQSERVTSRHHDSPRWIYGPQYQGLRIQPAPVINHQDAELEMLEALHGRAMPKGFYADEGPEYGERRERLRRDY